MKVRQLLLSLFVLLTATTARADVEINETTFPDENFRKWILSQDYGKDGILTDAEIAGVKKIGPDYIYDIKSLKGIEYFTALTELRCDYNPLTELDLSKNTALTMLTCSNCQLTLLNVKGCTALTSLDCHNNQLTSLDVSGCSALEYLLCWSNRLAALSVSGCTALINLDCNNNQLTALYVSGCTTLGSLNCYSNQLTSLNVSGCTALTSLNFCRNQIKGKAMDALVESLPKVNSKKMIVIDYENEQNVMTTEQVAAAKAKGWIPYHRDVNKNVMEYAGSEPGTEGIAINEQNFPDNNFRNWILNQDYGKDGILTDNEIAGVKTINIQSEEIQDLKGIEFFTALTRLSCNDNELTTLDLSKNTALTWLGCSINELTALDVSNNTMLTELYCNGNLLTTLDVSGCTTLSFLNCERNELTSLKVSGCTELRYLYCVGNQLTSLDATGCTALKILHCYDNKLTSLNVSGCTALNELKCNSNKMTSIDVSECTALNHFVCTSNQLTTLDLSKNTALTFLDCENNQIRGTGMDALIESLPIVSDGRMYVMYGNDDQNVMTTVQVGAAKAKGWTPYYYDSSIWKWVEYAGVTGVAIDEENFPDEIFRKWVLNQERIKNSFLTDDEIVRIVSILFRAKGIQSLKGIEYLTALTYLDCRENNLTSLDVSKNTALEILYCSSNQLTLVDVTGSTALTRLDCSNNKLTSLDVSGCTALTELICDNNQLISLNVSENPALKFLSCVKNQLTTLDVSKIIALETLRCQINQLSELNLSQNTALSYLNCAYNLLTTLDASKNTKLTELNCSLNQIKGAGMDALVDKLPNVSKGKIYVIEGVKDQNVMTTIQVAAAKAKGWTPYYYNYLIGNYDEYEGSEPEYDFATLTYITGGQSTMQITVKTGEVTLSIVPEENWVVDKLTVNEVDMLSALADNKLTLSVKNDTEVRVTFCWADAENLYTEDLETGIATIKGENVKVYVRDGQLCVDGAAEKPVRLYTVDGMLVKSVVPQEGGIGMFNLPAGTYIVQVGKKAAKVVIKN